MTINGSRISVVSFALANLILASCAGKPEQSEGTSKLVEALRKPLDNLAVLKPVSPYAAVGGGNEPPLPSVVTESVVDPAAKIRAPATESDESPSSMAELDTSQLIGLNSPGLHRLLGKPALVRREAEAEVWQYRAADCVLHLFLYRDLTNEFYRVVHIAANYSRSIKKIGVSADSNSVEQTRLIKSCLSRLFHQAKALENSS